MLTYAEAQHEQNCHNHNPLDPPNPPALFPHFKTARLQLFHTQTQLTPQGSLAEIAIESNLFEKCTAGEWQSEVECDTQRGRECGG